MLIPTTVTYQLANQERKQTVFSYAQQEVPALISSTYVTPDSTIIRTTAGKLRALMTYLKWSPAFQLKAISDLAIVDRLRSPRFVVNYALLSRVLCERVTVQLPASETSPIPSLTSGARAEDEPLSPAANWHEREAYDMFGLYFTNHKNMTRILSDYGFRGHPLRKEFPLTGYTELLYDDTQNRVITQSVELAQELRVFHF